MSLFIQNTSTPPAISVLLYHRIAEPVTDPWGIAVSPSNFTDQIHYLKQNCNIISMQKLVEQVKTGIIKENAVCISFDDGYGDNFTVAKPILERYECPGIFFIATGFVGSEVNFWWEDLEAIFLRQPILPHKLDLWMEDIPVVYRLPATVMSNQELASHETWKWYHPPPTERCNVFLDLWQKLRILGPEEIAKQMMAIKSWAGHDDNNCFQSLAMNETQLMELTRQSLFTIGLHTANHIDLSNKPFSAQLGEIRAGKDYMVKQYGVESDFISFPYGRFDQNTIAAFDEFQLKAGFTTEAACIVGNSHPAKLGRFQVFNDNLEAFREYFQI